MRFFIITICCVVLVPAMTSGAEDWPMWRHDAGRTAVTAMELPESLQLQWVRHLPAITPAFHNARLQFDAGYEPIVAGGKLLIASSGSDSLTAYETSTGEETWVVRTNGPIRFAPAVWNDSVCFGSDDGHLYCVNLQTGKLRWKYRAVPGRRRLLGNQRLISVWPIRGGPVVMDGQVYFAAGVWPFEGVFVHALDIKSGTEIWRNDSLGYLFGQQPHNTQAIGGLAPQGYLVASGEQLIVPCSTAYPALLNRKTGELIEFQLPGPGRFPGGWFAAIDQMSAREIRRGKITFDDVINRQQHEDKLYKGYGVSGISRTIRLGDKTLNFDDAMEGVSGTIHAIIAADDRLFISTREGKIYCFAGGVSGSEVKNWYQPKSELVAAPQAIDFAKMLISESSGSHGYALVVGLHDGSLVKALLKESNYHVIAIDDDPTRVDKLRLELDQVGLYGSRAAVIQCDLGQTNLPPYIATVMTTESPQRLVGQWLGLLGSLRPFGGIAALSTAADSDHVNAEELRSLQPGNFERLEVDSQAIIRRVGPLPGATDYTESWSPSPDALVRFPLGVLWFDDTLAHFKRSPQPQFREGVMISRPKDWHAPRVKGEYKTDYPLLPPVLSDIYTGRVLSDVEQTEMREGLTQNDPTKAQPSQYRPPRQTDDWKPDQPVVGQRINPMTGEMEPRSFPKTYGCDGGVDYGSFYTLRAGTPAFYDKTLESGTVFLSGPRSGCTNSIIPAGGLLNVPYFFEGCTCSYPLPTAMSLYAMPENHEQWSSWGETEIKDKSIERIGLNFGAPGDRITRDGTLWLDYPSVGGPSPKIRVVASPVKPKYRYRHSVWMKGGEGAPWITASAAEGLGQLTLQDLKPGRYTVRLFFAEPDSIEPDSIEPDSIERDAIERDAIERGRRVQDVSLQGQIVLDDFDVLAQAGGSMRGIVRQFDNVEVDDSLTLSLSASQGESLISGIEIIRN